MSRITLRCKGCKQEFEVELKSIENDKYIQCPNPYCRMITKNPAYRE